MRWCLPASGREHRERLAEHGRFGFDAADTPAEDAERIDHGGVRIGANERIGICLHAIAVGHGADNPREVFDVYLVADAGVGRDNFEITECFRTPAEEGVALDVALKFEFGVQTKRVHVAEIVHLHGVIDNQFRGEQRIDALGIAAHFLDGFAHGGKIDDCGNTGEILKKNAGGHESDFFLRAVRSPLGKGSDVVFADETSVFTA